MFSKIKISALKNKYRTLIFYDNSSNNAIYSVRICYVNLIMLSHERKNFQRNMTTSSIQNVVDLKKLYKSYCQLQNNTYKTFRDGVKWFMLKIRLLMCRYWYNPNIAFREFHLEKQNPDIKRFVRNEDLDWKNYN